VRGGSSSPTAIVVKSGIASSLVEDVLGPFPRGDVAVAVAQDDLGRDDEHRPQRAALLDLQINQPMAGRERLSRQQWPLVEDLGAGVQNLGQSVAGARAGTRGGENTGSD